MSRNTSCSQVPTIILVQPVAEIGLQMERGIGVDLIPGLPAAPLPSPAAVPEVNLRYVYSYRHINSYLKKRGREIRC